MTAINKAMTRYDAYMTENCGGLLPTTDDRLVNYNVSARLIAMDVVSNTTLLLMKMQEKIYLCKTFFFFSLTLPNWVMKS